MIRTTRPKPRGFFSLPSRPAVLHRADIATMPHAARHHLRVFTLLTRLSIFLTVVLLLALVVPWSLVVFDLSNSTSTLPMILIAAILPIPKLSGLMLFVVIYATIHASFHLRIITAHALVHRFRLCTHCLRAISRSRSHDAACPACLRPYRPRLARRMWVKLARSRLCSFHPSELLVLLDSRRRAARGRVTPGSNLANPFTPFWSVQSTDRVVILPKKLREILRFANAVQSVCFFAIVGIPLILVFGITTYVFFEILSGGTVSRLTVIMLHVLPAAVWIVFSAFTLSVVFGFATCARIGRVFRAVRKARFRACTNCLRDLNHAPLVGRCPGCNTPYHRTELAYQWIDAARLRTV